jgi:copper chaperone NosL
MNPKFGGEIITKKGRTYKFDDAHCVVNFIKAGNVKEADIAQTVFINYQQENTFLDAKTAQFVVSEQLKSPMNSNAAAFASKQAAEQTAKETAGTVKSWNDLYQYL